MDALWDCGGGRICWQKEECDCLVRGFVICAHVRGAAGGWECIIGVGVGCDG